MFSNLLVSFNNSFKFRSEYQGIVFALKLLVVTLIFINFAAFREFDKRDTNRVKGNVETLLRNESSTSNSYAISKTLVDLESLGIFQCARLQEAGNSNRTYYDSMGSSCAAGLFDSFRIHEVSLKGLNGNSYRLSFFKTPNVFALIVEAFVYLFLILVFIFFPRLILNIERSSRTRLAALEIEKNLMIDIAKQVQHDVASPLSAINSVISILDNVDPLVKEILTSASKRTQEIFNDFNLHDKKSQQMTNPLSCLIEIMKEKEQLWGSKVEFKLEKSAFASLGRDVYVVANDEKLKRTFSNILNNAYEAFCLSKELNVAGSILEVRLKINVEGQFVQIEFEDNGPGFGSAILDRVGEKGFSYGKEAIENAGSGLGIYDAKTVFKSWGGRVDVSNSLEGGAHIACYLKLLQ